jgi:hypothetical protein
MLARGAFVFTLKWPQGTAEKACERAREIATRINRQIVAEENGGG